MLLYLSIQGRIQDFKLGGAHLKKLRRAEGGAKIVGVFRVKNHDFTPKNHIFPISGGGARNFWGISCEKSRFYAKKIIFFSNFRGGARRGRPPPESAPGISTSLHKFSTLKLLFFSFSSCLTIERSIVFKTVDRQCESFSRMFIMRVWYFYNEGLLFL